MHVVTFYILQFTVMLPIGTLMFFFGMFAYAIAVAFFPIWYLLNLLTCQLGKYGKIESAAEAEKKHGYVPIKVPEGSKFKICIVGCGWCGMQAGKTLKDKGIEVKIFETKSDIGGTWNAENAYHGQKLHSAGWLAEFHEFPMDDDARQHRVPAEEVQAYNHRYYEWTGLKPFTEFNSKVTMVHYDSQTRKSTVTVENLLDGAVQEFGDFDMVLYTSLTSKHTTPKWPEQEKFKGEVLHCSQLTKEKFDSYTHNNKRVCVIGGNKSACDMLFQLHEAKLPKKNLIWLSRSDYHFMYYPNLFHNRSLFGMMRGHFFVFAMGLALFSPVLSLAMLRITGLTVQPKGFHFNQKKFHFGTVSVEEVNMLKSTDRVKDEIGSFGENSIKLKGSKEELPVDIVICATGFETGMTDVKLFTDKVEVPTSKKTQVFEGILHMGCPGFAICAMNVYSSGIKRGVSVADHVASILIRQPTAKQMKDWAARTHAAETGSGKHMQFNGKINMLLSWLVLYLDLWRQNVVSAADEHKHFTGMFVQNRHVPLQFLQPKVQ